MTARTSAWPGRPGLADAGPADEVTARPRAAVGSRPKRPPACPASARARSRAARPPQAVSILGMGTANIVQVPLSAPARSPSPFPSRSPPPPAFFRTLHVSSSVSSSCSASSLPSSIISPAHRTRRLSGSVT